MYRIYQSLPEVTQMAEEKKRQELCKTNRLRVQLYKQVQVAVKKNLLTLIIQQL